MSTRTDQPTVATRLAEAIVGGYGKPAPAELRARCEEMLIDIAGLTVAARDTDYMRAALAGWEGEGPCTAIGHTHGRDAASAALLNGLAAHGEDFDDTFEGGPVHAGVVMVPAILAIAERERLAGADAL
jgi:2-methylcitrate dehydratase PrpD